MADQKRDSEETGDGEAGSSRRKCFCNCGDVVFLEEADGGDAGGSGCEAGMSVG